MKPRSAKQKGSRWERKVAKYYRTKLGFKEARRMPLSGGFSALKGDIYKRMDGWKDECKNQEKVQLWKWWQQTTAQCGFNEKPVLHITRNRGAELSVISTEDYFNMRQEIAELKSNIKENAKSATTRS